MQSFELMSNKDKSAILWNFVAPMFGGHVTETAFIVQQQCFCSRLHFISSRAASKSVSRFDLSNKYLCTVQFPTDAVFLLQIVPI